LQLFRQLEIGGSVQPVVDTLRAVSEYKRLVVVEIPFRRG